MGDIVDSLRNAPIAVRKGMFDAHTLLEDAASEIERLRSELANESGVQDKE